MLIYIFLIIISLLDSSQNSLDLTKCKVTHRGSEYMGRNLYTESNKTCLYWSSSEQKEAKEMKDEEFPDGSKRLAKNYCRNPNLAESGPWCYTSDPKLIKDSCNVSFCHVMNCRYTGPGVEYSGNISKSLSGRQCTKWKSTHKLKPKKTERNFKGRDFPDGSTYDAGNKCRNPTGNVSGPWCYVEVENSKLHEVELCDIPFCDEVDPLIYSANIEGHYAFFSSFTVGDSLKVGIRLWDAEDWMHGRVYIILSGIDVYGKRSEIKRWKSSLEIILSNMGSRISNGEETEIQYTPHILSGVKWNVIEVTWVTLENNILLVQAFKEEENKPFLITEVELSNTLLGETSFRYVSLSGSAALWNVSSDDDGCQVHTSPTMNFTRYWLMRKTTLGIDVDFYVRAVAKAVLVFRASPVDDKHQVHLVIGDGEKIKVTVYNEDGKSAVIGETAWPNILDYWRWENIKIRFLKDSMQMHWVRPTQSELVMDIKHPRLSEVLWVSFGSPFASHWAMYCDPRGTLDPPLPVPPECMANERDDYNGTQSVTSAGHQCIPWTDDEAIPIEYRKPELFERYGGKVPCQNFCRNLNGDEKGPFCIVRDDKNGGYVREYCYPRSCDMGECRLAGTANDYTGHLNRTRSKRECRSWLEKVDEPYVRIENFPDPTMEDTGNNCRNPDKNVGGPWCFTQDRDVPSDFCFVRDCGKPLDCTVIASSFRRGHSVYIMPRWRKHGLEFWLKAWNPDIYEGLKIKLISQTSDKSYTLLIGDENNEKLKFYVDSGNGDDRLLVSKTMLHLVPAGKWGGFWLRPGLGKVELGYHESKISFFEWTAKEDADSFDPIFIDFGTIEGQWIGVNFKCTECLLEETSFSEPSRIYPINLWREHPGDDVPSQLVLHFRGDASVGILLMSNPDFNNYIIVQLSSNAEKISIWEFIWNFSNSKLAEYDNVQSFTTTQWTTYQLSFEEKSISLIQGDSPVFTWKSRKPLLFYWFSIKVYVGVVTWTANCPPDDIDGPPRDGQWGPWEPWTCSVTCGGGQGRTQRKCNNPRPNIFGRECKGVDVYDGPCNTFRCGDISPGTFDMIRLHLSSNYSSLEVPAGKKAILPCNPNGRALVMAEVKKMNITWTVNGFPYSRRRARINDEYSLVIPNAQDVDSGVYFCMVRRPSGVVPAKIVIDVVSLIVNHTGVTKSIRLGREFYAKCNGLALSYVYGDLSQRWEINGKTWKDYGITTLETVSVDHVQNVTLSHDGIWTCVVDQKDLGFKWRTNWMHIGVKSAPDFWSNLREDPATSPIFGKIESDLLVKLVFFILLTLLLLIAVVPIIVLIKTRTSSTMD